MGNKEILEKKFKVKINSERCKGCGLCIEFCPKQVFEKTGEPNEIGYHFVSVINEQNCIGCGQCYLMCAEPGCIKVCED